mmetsp:Transcript_59255/g.72470  ORF Transcript_59255/g.72470 Transcript_59255/m.72470 type:complete len:436 (-) Transcript_59255:73-1380(-)
MQNSSQKLKRILDGNEADSLNGVSSDGYAGDNGAVTSPHESLKSMDSIPVIYDDIQEDITVKNKVGGMICIAICVITWVSMSELIPVLDSDWNHPYFLRFCVNFGYTYFVIVWLIVRKIRMKKYKKQNIIINYPNKNWYKKLFIDSAIINLSILISCWIWYISLDHTGAAVNNTIYQSSVVVAYVLSILFMGTKVKTQKNIGVIISLIGLIIVTMGNKILIKIWPNVSLPDNDDETPTTTAGIVLCIISTVMYGINEVYFQHISNKYFHEKYNVEDSLLCLAMMGISTLMFCWPMFIILNFNIEPFSFPPTLSDTMGIIATCLGDSLYWAAVLIGISLTDAVFIAMGQLLVIPVSFLADVLFHNLKITFMPVFGSLCIAIGFTLMEVDVKQKYRQLCSKNKDSNIIAGTKYENMSNDINQSNIDIHNDSLAINVT